MTAIIAICQYQRDLLTLFIDLKAANRKYFYDVRLKSLQLSVEQVLVMHEQMRINHFLTAHRDDELALVPTENKLIRSSIDLLQQAIHQIQSIR